MPSNTPAAYNFDINTVLSEAWEKIKGFKGTFFVAALLAFLINGAALFIISDIANALQGPVTSVEMHGKFNFVREILSLAFNVFVLIPIGAGLMMLGVKRSVNAVCEYQSIFSYFSYWNKLWPYPVIFAVLTWIYRLAAHVPFMSIVISILIVYLSISYLMFVPLVIDKKLSPWDALETSRKTISSRWFKFFWLIILLGILILLSLIPVGIPLVWTLPWMYCTLGILYRNIFGVSNIK